MNVVKTEELRTDAAYLVSRLRSAEKLLSDAQESLAHYSGPDNARRCALAAVYASSASAYASILQAILAAQTSR